MAQIITLRTRTTRDSRKEQIRLDVEDLLHMLLTLKEQELGHPVARSALVPPDLSKLVPLFGARIEEVEELGGVRLGNPWVEKDTVVPGLLDRFNRVIVVAKNPPLAQQRYTVAHEIAHLLYHSSPRHLRERTTAARVSTPTDAKRATDETHKREERDAEVFAAEFLMPADLVTDAMIQRFGSPIDGTIPRDELAYFISSGVGRTIQPRHLAHMPQQDRAALFALANNFQGTLFEPLDRTFVVSTQAMAIRLLELGLVA